MNITVVVDDGDSPCWCFFVLDAVVVVGIDLIVGLVIVESGDFMADSRRTAAAGVVEFVEVVVVVVAAFVAVSFSTIGDVLVVSFFLRGRFVPPLPFLPSLVPPQPLLKLAAAVLLIMMLVAALPFGLTRIWDNAGSNALRSLERSSKGKVEYFLSRSSARNDTRDDDDDDDDDEGSEIDDDEDMNVVASRTRRDLIESQ